MFDRILNTPLLSFNKHQKRILELSQTFLYLRYGRVCETMFCESVPSGSAHSKWKPGTNKRKSIYENDRVIIKEMNRNKIHCANIKQRKEKDHIVREIKKLRKTN